MCIISGALSPTEAYNARVYGADFIKVFPANVFGASYFKTLKAPLPDIPMLAFAGIGENNIAEYIKAGAIGAGIGSELINLSAIEKGDFEYVENKAKALINCVQNARK